MAWVYYVKVFEVWFPYEEPWGKWSRYKLRNLYKCSKAKSRIVM